MLYILLYLQVVYCYVLHGTDSYLKKKKTCPRALIQAESSYGNLLKQRKQRTLTRHQERAAAAGGGRGGAGGAGGGPGGVGSRGQMAPHRWSFLSRGVNGDVDLTGSGVFFFLYLFIYLI